MKVKVEKFTIRHDGNKYILGSIFDMNKKEAERLLEKGYISVVEADEETIEEEKTETIEEEIINPEGKMKITEEEVINPKEKIEITEEEIENSEVAKKNKTSKKK